MMQVEGSDPAYFDYFIKSADGGTSWNRIANPDPANPWYLQPWGLVTLPTVPTTIYAGSPTEGVFKSVDGGGTFVFASSGLPTGIWLTDMVSADLNGSSLYVTGQQGVYKSIDGATTWVSASTGLPAVQAQRLAVHPSDPTTLYAATSSGIYKTTNGGDAWTEANTGWPLGSDGITPAQARAIVIDPVDPEVIYASTIANNIASVYTSRNGGGSWWLLNGNAGLDVVAIWRLVLDPADHTHIIASARGGLYETKLDLRRLTVGTSGTGGGSVTSTPGGISCGASCGFDFAVSSTVTLTQNAAVGSSFGSWSGACTGTGACQVTMDQARNVTAAFTLNSYDLTVSKTGTGTGSVASSPTGIDCGATCTASFTHGTVVTLSKSASANSVFSGWSGACSGSEACEVTMDQARNVTAIFNGIPTITAVSPQAGPTGGGQPVTITGTNLSNATSVTFGGTAGAITANTATSITVTTPSHGAGAVDVTVTNAGGSATSAQGYTYSAFGAPAFFSATATSTSQVALTWTAVSDATSYEVWRGSSLSGAYSLAVTVGGTLANDTGLSANTTYLYKVRAIAESVPSAFTAIDPATTIVFTDTNLTGVRIKAAHIAELRTAVNAMRLAAGLPAATFTDPALNPGSSVVKRLHVTEPRTALDGARSALGLPAISYTDPAITAGVTTMKAVHITGLRAGTQ